MLDDDGAVQDSQTTRRMGMHAGVGAELTLSRRLAMFGDYRYRFIRFGDPEAGVATAPGALPLPGTIGLQERMKLHHEGSMWTFGVLLNF
jgi:opacity protein-like surface antigen